MYTQCRAFQTTNLFTHTEKQRQKDEKDRGAGISSQRERRQKAPAIGRRNGRKIERASEKIEKYEKSREVHLFSKHSMRRRW